MDRNEISMFMDVKIDINEKKNEAGRLRNWTKCFVKIEAIKSFPCFFRVTFIRNVEEEAQNLCITIHVPGVQIRLTNSRTKAHSYGINWKHNRKRCCIYFAFENFLSCENHMKWFKESLKNLELHRREILETRRCSRDASSFLNLKSSSNTSEKKDWKLQDFLGPLPKIPDKRESINWSRRVSALSGIYEEINDSENLRRFSQASGIYEEMKPPKDMIIYNESPPELPARSRINTYQNESFEMIPRCNTNPETITAASKNKIFLQDLQNALFGRRSKRCESVSECKVSTREELIDINIKLPLSKNLILNKDKTENHIYQNVNVHLENIKPISELKSNILDIQNTNRNSFSSPDLSKINPVPPILTKDDLISNSSTINIFEISQSTDNINYFDHHLNNQYVINVENEPVKYNNFISEINIPNSNLNVSDRINESFNFSINSSTINLVGAKLNMIDSTDNSKYSKNFPKILVDDTSGYCTMVPIKINEINKSCEKNILNNCRKSSDSDKENIDNSIELNENNLHKNHFELNKDENIRMNSIELFDNVIENYYQTPKKTINIDDKIPSYYPNNCNIKKSPNSINYQLTPSTSNLNNKMIITQQKTPNQIDKNSETVNVLKKITPLKACKISENVYSVRKYESTPNNKNDIYANNEIVIDDDDVIKTTPTTTMSFGKLLQSIEFKFDDSKNINFDTIKTNNTTNVQKLLTPSTPLSTATTKTGTTVSNHYLTLNNISTGKSSPINTHKNDYEKNNETNIKITSTPELNSTKKISSLPRFKKIDFSPLKLKIHNVLQRNNSDGV